MRRYALTHRVNSTVFEACKKFCTRLSRENDCRTNNSFLLIQLLTDQDNWKNAYTINVSGMTALVLPVKKSPNIPVPFADKFLLLGFDQTILMSMNHAGNINFESVILLPDNDNGFTGNLLTDPWLMNSLNRPWCASLICDAPQVLKHKPPTNESNLEPETESGVNTGDSKIANIKDYLRCFDNNPSDDHTYELMVCVAQPEPGTRKPWGIGERGSGNPVDVGHAFLVAKETTPNKTVVRNIGFYPISMVWPYSPSAQGMLNNDSYHDFNIALSITTTSHQFTQVLSYLLKGNDKGYQYNLNNNNCTDFILNALLEGNIILPRTIGTWHHGKGLNPGDLGEDIRKLPLSPNMKRITSYCSHPNQGSCV